MRSTWPPSPKSVTTQPGAPTTSANKKKARPAKKHYARSSDTSATLSTNAYSTPTAADYRALELGHSTTKWAREDNARTTLNPAWPASHLTRPGSSEQSLPNPTTR